MKTSSKIFWGLFFLLSGVTIIVNQLGYLTDLNIYTLFFSIFIVAILIKSISKLNWCGISFSIAAILIMYSKELNIENLTPWPVLFTAFFTSIGLYVLFHKPSKCSRKNKEGYYETIIDEPDDNNVLFDVNFGSSIKYINSDSLERASLSCSFASLKVYFDNTKISKKGAVININGSFAGIELYFPRDWKVVNDIRCSLAGVDEKNKRRDGDTNSPTVKLTGNISLSGVEIFYI